MKGRNPLNALDKIWAEVLDLQRKVERAKARAEDEVRRLARNKHRARALKELYWDPRERLPVMVLAELFSLEVQEVSLEAGPFVDEAACNLCSRVFRLELKNRSARRAAELELTSKTQNPKYLVCSHCSAFRETDLQLLRKQKGAKLDSIHYAAYQRYLRTPQWKERRDKALKRAKYRCQLCDRKQGLNVHHRNYKRIGNEKLEDLTVLCRSCHEEHHGL